MNWYLILRNIELDDKFVLKKREFNVRPGFFLQLPVEKPEPTEDMIQPKSEYLDDPEESVEDLTLDDDMNDLNEMEDSNRAGPSSHDPNQHPGEFTFNQVHSIFFLFEN